MKVCVCVCGQVLMQELVIQSEMYNRYWGESRKPRKAVCRAAL